MERFEAIADRVLRERTVTPPEFKLAPGKRIRREEIVIRKLVLGAEAGDAECARILLDRKWPKPQKLEIEIPLEAIADAEGALERRIARVLATRPSPLNGHANGHDLNGHAPTDAESS